MALRRVIDAGWQFTGASDHLVSEALYLDDPEGNGIEIYRDRPRDEWRRDASGALEMATLPMDVEGVIGSAPDGTPDEGMPDGTAWGTSTCRWPTSRKPSATTPPASAST